MADFSHIPTKAQAKLIAHAVDSTVRELFPEKYSGLCYVYAVVGAALLSHCQKKPYRPVAGIAIINAGKGQCLELLDDLAFLRPGGGAFHCWIESTGTDLVEIVDFSFGNNPEYAKAHGIEWHEKKRAYLWEIREDVLWERKNDVPLRLMPKGKVWFSETELGQKWLQQQLSKNSQEYAKIVSLALRKLRMDCDEYRKNSREFRKKTEIFMGMYLYPSAMHSIEIIESLLHP